jgi:hypothetical protein
MIPSVIHLTRTYIISSDPTGSYVYIPAIL